MADNEREDWDGSEASSGNGSLPVERDANGRIARADWGSENLEVTIQMPRDALPPRTSPHRLPRDGRGRILRPSWDTPPAKQVAEPDGDTMPAPPEAYDGNLVLADHESLPVELHEARDFIEDVVTEIEGADAYIEAFTGELSANAQDGLVTALSNLPSPTPYDVEQLPYDRAKHDEFRGTPEGEVLWNEWGDEGPLRFHAMQQRWLHIRNSLPAHERETFDRAVDALPPAATIAAFRRLAE